MRTARAAEVPSIGVLWGFRDEAELRDAGALALAASAGELREIINS